MLQIALVLLRMNVEKHMHLVADKSRGPPSRARLSWELLRAPLEVSVLSLAANTVEGLGPSLQGAAGAVWSPPWCPSLEI